MGRLDTSKAAELRLLARTLRYRALDMTLPNYVAMMFGAAAELDEEAALLDHGFDIEPGRHIDIVI